MMAAEKIFKIKSGCLSFLYRRIFRNFFFLLEAEKIHDFILGFGELLGSFPWAVKAVGFFFDYQNAALQQEILGIKFRNPIGLAAGFDKDARLTAILPAVGFGFAEVGSITGCPCSGNPKPRLWRLPKSRSLVINYGLKNEGSRKIALRLGGKKFAIPIGTSVAKTNSPQTVETEAGIADYAKAYRALADLGSYTTVNISCPNAFGGEPFTDPERLEKLLGSLETIPTRKPVFIKLSPDLSREEIEGIIGVSRRHKIDGFICANLTKNRNNPAIIDGNVPEKGGISGKVEEKLVDDLIGYVYRRTGGRFVIIGCGGVFTAEDAYRKIRLGATLVQMITGMIFEGPQVIGQINSRLVELLRRDGFKNISPAVGVDNPVKLNPEG